MYTLKKNKKISGIFKNNNNNKEYFVISEELKIDVFKKKLNQLNKLTTLNNNIANVITEVENIFELATKPTAKRT